MFHRPLERFLLGAAVSLFLFVTAMLIVNRLVRAMFPPTSNFIVTPIVPNEEDTP